MSGRTQRLRYDKLNKLHIPKFRRLGLIAFIGGMLMLSVWLFVGELTGATVPADYALNLDVEVTNTTSEDLNYLVPFSIDSSLLNDFDIVNAGFTDILFADLNDVVTKGFVEDISNATSTWFAISTAPAGQIQIEQIYLTGPTAEHVFPAHLPNATRLDAANSSSLQIEDDLSATITVDSTSCGTLQAKHDLELGDDASGWGVYFLGNKDFPEHTPQSWGFASDANLYYDITPIGDLILCGVSTGKTNFSSIVERIRVQDVAADEVILDTTLVYYPQFTETSEGTLGLLATGVHLTGGTQYRVFLDFPAASGHYATSNDLDVTSDIARYHHDVTSIDFDGTGYRKILFDSDGSELGLPQIVNAGMLWMHSDITLSTSTVADISNSGILDASVNCISLFGSGNDIRWKGTEATFTLSYSTTTGDLTLIINGFPIAVTLPSCDLFGNKTGGQSGMTAISSFENPSDDQLVTSLFTLTAGGNLSAINVPINYDRNSNTRSGVDMVFTIRAAIYDSARNFIASPAAKVLTINLEDGSSQILNFEFIVPLALSADDYYLAYWASDPQQVRPPTSTDVVGNEEIEESEINSQSNIAQRVYTCRLPFNASIIADNEWITIESINIYVESVYSSRLMRGAFYTDSGTLDFQGETEEITPVNGWNKLDLLVPFTYKPSDVGPGYMAIWTDEILHDVPLSIAQYAYDAWGQPLQPPWPEGRSNFDVEACRASDPNPNYPTWPDPVIPTQAPNTITGGIGQFLLSYVDFSRNINLSIRPNSKTSSSNTVEVDDIEYTGSWPDPFVNDSPYANQELVIWGDLELTSALPISTSTVPYLAGGGLTGKIDDLFVTGDTGFALFTPFNPSNNSLTQIGNAGNDWTWQGLIQDGSGSNNDLTYTIISDQTGVTVELIPLGANAVPLSFQVPELPNIVGEPGLDVFTTSEAITPSTIMDKLRNVAGNGDFPASMFWLMLGSLVLVALSSVAMKALTYDMVPWGISLVGFYLISVIAGPDFLILWVALNALYATGVLLIMNFSR